MTQDVAASYDAYQQANHQATPVLRYGNPVVGGIVSSVLSLIACGGCDITYTAPPGSGEATPVGYPGEILLYGAAIPIARSSAESIESASVSSTESLLLNPQNIANGPRLTQQLTWESATSSFNLDGTLTQQAIRDSQLIIGPQRIINPAVPSGYGKYSTQTLQSPYGDFQTHFYMNQESGNVYYGLDYKTIFNSMSGVPKKL